MFQSQLNSYVKTVHENKKYHKCHSCEKSFSHAGSLKTHHTSVHNVQKDHKCESYGMAFFQVGLLKTHINAVHNGKKKSHMYMIHVLVILTNN